MKIRLISSVLLIAAGLFVLIYTSFKWSQFSQTSPKGQINITATEREVKPIKLYVPKLGKTLGIVDGVYEDGHWTIAPTGVSYLISSAPFTSPGNSVLYGHNTQDILGGLWRIEANDPIYVVLDSGDFVKYQVVEEKEIKPEEVQILNQTSDTRLTIYTCSGFLDQARFVVVATKV